MKCYVCGAELKKSTFDGEEELICVNPDHPMPCDSCGKQMHLIGEHWYCRNRECPDYAVTHEEAQQLKAGEKVWLPPD